MTFGIDALQPKKLAFALSDGTEIPFTMQVDFSLEENGRFRDLFKQISNVNKQYEKTRDDGKKAKCLQREFELTLDVVKMILPDLPESDLAKIDNLSKATKILNYWAKENATEEAEEDFLIE